MQLKSPETDIPISQFHTTSEKKPRKDTEYSLGACLDLKEIPDIASSGEKSRAQGKLKTHE